MSDIVPQAAILHRPNAGTSTVVVGASAGSKLDKARELAIDTWDEPLLLKTLAALGVT